MLNSFFLAPIIGIEFGLIGTKPSSFRQLPVHTLDPHSSVHLFQHILKGCLHLILNGAFKFTPVYKVCPVLALENGALDHRLEPCSVSILIYSF